MLEAAPCDPPTTPASNSVEQCAGSSDREVANKQLEKQTTSNSDCVLPQTPAYDVQSPTAQPLQPSTLSFCPSYTPDDVRHFPSAPPRKMSSRRTGKTRILTSTPVKDELAKRQSQKANKVSNRASGQAASCSTVLFGNSRKRRSPLSTSQRSVMKKSKVVGDDDNPPCLYCGELFRELHRELRQWIRCEGKCAKWAHAVCAGMSAKDKNFICENCITD